MTFVVFAVDYYLHRTSWRRLILEKIPFLVLSLIFGVIGIFVLKSIGALKINEMFTFPERLFFGLYSLSAYILKFFVPITLSALYPYPVSSGNALPALYYLSPVFVLLAAVLVYFTSRNTRAIVFGALVFLFSVMFMLQIFGAGQGFMADRYVKVPYLGLVFIVGWTSGKFSARGKTYNFAINAVLAFFSFILIILSYQRTEIWKNGGTLWGDVIEKFPNRDARPYACRGLYFRAEQNNERALPDLNQALTLDPGDHEIRLMRGNIYFDKGKDDSAYRDYLTVLKIKMDNPLALSNLGAIYVRRGQLDSAVYYLTRSIEFDSTIASSYANRAVAYNGLGRVDETISDFRHYLVFKPDDERVCMSIALACQRKQDYRESLVWLDRAIRIKPDFGFYYYTRSQTYNRLGEKSKALADAIKAESLGIQVPGAYLQSLK